MRLVTNLSKHGRIQDIGNSRDEVVTCVEVPNLQDSGTFYVYNHGIVLDPSDFLEQGTDGTCMGASAVAMFNTGLAFHQAAMACPNTSLSQSAIRSYHVCIQLMMRVRNHNLFSTALVAAATNNLAHAHLHFFGQKGMAIMYLNSIQPHLPLLMTKGSILEDNVDEIGMNVQFAGMILWAAAGAA
jgi:hypothetical protein